MRSCWVSARSRALSALSRSPFNWLDISWTCRVRSASWPATLAMSSLAVLSAGFHAASGTARCSRKSLRQPRQHYEVSMESDPLKPTDAKWCQPALGRRVHRCPKGADRGPHIVRCKTAFSRDRGEGQRSPSLDPWHADAVMVGEGHSPVVSILLASKHRHSSASAHPKASAPSAVTHFSCKAATSEGAALGASVPIMDPRSWRRPRLCGRLGAEVMPPLWQYFLRLREKTA
jgi:hypothetical protein